METKCITCGNTLFDQGLSTLWCGACGTTYWRHDLRFTYRNGKHVPLEGPSPYKRTSL